MEPIIEKSINGRNIFIYEVEIEYQIVRAADQARYDNDLKQGKAAEPPSVQPGAYVRLFDAKDVEEAIYAAVQKFQAFVQGQDALVRYQDIRRCDLKFRGHAF